MNPKPQPDHNQPASLDQIKAQHKDLGERANQAENKAALAPEAEALIQTLRKAGREIPPGSGRDLLRSLASYWATFVYSNSTTGVYPSTELEPYLGPPVTAEKPKPAGIFSRLPVWAWVAIGVAFLALVLTGLVLSIGNLVGVGYEDPTPTVEIVEVTEPPLETPAFATQTAGMATQTAIAGTPPETPTVDFTATASAETMTATPVPAVPTPLATAPAATVGSPSQPVIGVQVINIKEGQEVNPAETLSIQYTGLQPGWTLHLLLQPIGAGGRYFPLTELLLIDSNNTSGTWNVEVAFDGELGSQYNLTTVIAISAEGRKILEGGAANGLAELPEGVISLPQVLTVQLSASALIDEVRLVYSAYQTDSGRIEIMTAREDGSDIRRITTSGAFNKLYPALSPTGDQIAFVGREIAPSGEVQDTLWVVGSDGQNMTQLLLVPGLTMERPAWSPDGGQIAFSANYESEWQVILYDIAQGATNTRSAIPAGARFPAWSLDGRSLYFSAPAERTRTTAIYRYDFADNNLSLVYDSEGDDSEPALSPDGLILLFTVSTGRNVSSREPGNGIWMIILDTGAAAQLVSAPYPVHYPRWHPSEPIIYFESLIDGSYTVWAVSPTSDNLRQITAGPADRWPTVGQIRVYLPERGGQ